MHQIRLYQSTWADALRLMHRWGSWGHYDGTCTLRGHIKTGQRWSLQNRPTEVAWD
jgi:hypothetical protein